MNSIAIVWTGYNWL